MSPGYRQRQSRLNWQQAAQDMPCEAVGSPTALFTAAEAERIELATRAKALEALAAGDLPPGKELELVSALDLCTLDLSPCGPAVCKCNILNSFEH